MFIEQLVLEGFKSYAQRTVVGPFDASFNAITGFNGSGKSNILDAICFVLGISNLQQVRVHSVQELVYKHGQAGVKKATVSIVFNNDNRDASPVGYEHCDKITVTRQVVIGGRNKYMINGAQAQLQKVTTLFHSCQLNVNNPHFLIMQGRITKVMNMKPEEILGLIQEAAGTRMFEMRKANAMKTMEKKESKMAEISRVLDEDITPTLDRLRGEQAAYLEWTSNDEKLARLRRYLVAVDFVSAVASAEEAEAEMERMTALIVRSEAELAEAQAGKARVAATIAQRTAERESHMGRAFQALEASVAELSKAAVKAQSAATNVRDQLQSEVAALNGMVSTEQSMPAETAKLDAAIGDAERAVVAAQSALKDKEAEIAGLQRSLQQLESGNAVDASADAHRMRELKEEVTSSTIAMKEAELKLEHHKQRIDEKRKLAQRQAKENARADGELRDSAAKMAAFEAELGKLKYDEAVEEGNRARRDELQSRVAAAKEIVSALRGEMGNLNFDYTLPASFDRARVKGLVAGLVTLNDVKYDTALEVTAGSRLYHVVVDTEETGKLLLNKGSLRQRVTIIPLNRVSASPLSTRVVQAAARLAGDRATPAIQLIGFAQELKPAMEFVFGSTMVCEDLATAKMITFSSDARCRTVTVDGDVVDPSGTMSGGSKPSSGGVLKKLQKLAAATDKLKALEAELGPLDDQIARAKHVRDQYFKIKDKLELAAHAHGLLKERMSVSAYGKTLKDVEVLETESAEYKAALDAASAAKSAAERKLKALESEAQAGAAGKRDQSAMQRQLTEARKELAALTKRAKAAEMAFEKATLAKDAFLAEMSTLRDKMREKRSTVAKLEAELAVAETGAEAAKAAHTAKSAELAQQKAQMTQADAEIRRLTKEHDKLQKSIDDAQIHAKKHAHQQQHAQLTAEAAKASVRGLQEKNRWIEKERGSFGKAGTEFDFERKRVAAARKDFGELDKQQAELGKRINKKVMSMFEKAESEYNELLHKKRITENDKRKIEEVIAELDEKKNEALQQTWEKVNRDFGSIFSMLLPGVTCKLEPPPGMTVLDGLEVKVAFGDVWKESLSELSGGQRSLLALSLILALLRFKPAPVYILDEVDAALDLSHTQNIGRMLKEHFSESQFVIVSLKEGMFNNANVLFRTEFLEGVSTVRRTVPDVPSDVRARVRVTAAAAPGTLEKENSAPPAASGKAGKRTASEASGRRRPRVANH